MLNNKEIAPGFSLPGLDGNILSLDEILRGGQKVLLIFLRHLG